MSCSSEDYPSENVSPQLDALVAMALVVLLLGGGTRAGYLVARIARWLMRCSHDHRRPICRLDHRGRARHRGQTIKPMARSI